MKEINHNVSKHHNRNVPKFVLDKSLELTKNC